MKKIIEKDKSAVVEVQKKLSVWRAFLAMFILAGVFYGIALSLDRRKEQQTYGVYKPWFAAYVDVTSTPRYSFEHLGATSTPNAVLSFIVSSKEDPCVPTWGTYYTLDKAGVTLDLDRRIARLQQQGGQVAISFGGALNDELALNCTDEENLLKAYESVIEKYGVDTIDLDLENNGLTNSEALDRRAMVMARLQEKRKSENKRLTIWLTLPVSPQGLTPEGTKAVSQMLSSKVDLAGVNVMTMDYSNSKKPQQSMFEASRDALLQTHRQLGILYKQAEINLSPVTIWRKMGATPMIGQNDVASEVFSIEDANSFNKFAVEQGLGRMSMWSANRDIPCGENYVDLKIVSDSCSGVKTQKMSFAQTLSVGFGVDFADDASILKDEEEITTVQEVDDPTKSPYQIWQETAVYQAGVKVVWHGNVYTAKWWTKSDLPDNPVLQEYETPWRLVGPVLPGEKPIPQPTLPTGTYRAWSGTEIYEAGERVLFDGLPYQAKWWNEGESPAAAAVNADTSPWVQLSPVQIKALMDSTSKKN
ncbi:MAG: Chitinase [Candidatus Collierbacteria bacterium GW2011_GWB1_44_6]|uniref:Chitinase n=2 Tax=Candidatus Collieribacteriota TaxID=1752725 RepID=A0A0G1JMH0_9BACT|nr:MAG: Chitinase [Candidatus Collierbacteria bacterium GW2011_GWC2_43_12]KKT72583.1 MAG: Chitinase [Candidatus Collierbacteria bacterium GW2011_GWB1_44_6]KKT83431.1 MAG: Chitinase [Microgenomates group bacterium GW2011_GWC1_44_9]